MPSLALYSTRVDFGLRVSLAGVFPAQPSKGVNVGVPGSYKSYEDPIQESPYISRAPRHQDSYPDGASAS